MNFFSMPAWTDQKRLLVVGALAGERAQLQQIVLFTPAPKLTNRPVSTCTTLTEPPNWVHFCVAAARGRDGALRLCLRAVGDLAIANAGGDLEAGELAGVAERDIPVVVLAPGSRSGEAGKLRRLVLHRVEAPLALARLVAACRR